MHKILRGLNQIVRFFAIKLFSVKITLPPILKSSKTELYLDPFVYQPKTWLIIIIIITTSGSIFFIVMSNKVLKVVSVLLVLLYIDVFFF